MKLLPFIYVIVLSTYGFSTTWQVGPGHSYTTPNALYSADSGGAIDIEDFDTITIASGDYSGTDALAAWSQNNLYITGVDGMPHLIADGAYILGKGIWVCGGNDITVNNIEFSDASVPDENGAGIRLDGIGLTVSNCYFHNNENGILTNNSGEGDILIEYTEFENNGYGGGYTHNMYIGHVNKFTLRYCNSHHANVGHNVKSRATYNYILYNRIMDEETGNSSRLIDLPNGGLAIVKGNLLMQGPNAINNNPVGYGLEGLSNPAPHEFYFVHNTVINKRAASCNFLHIQDGTAEAYIANNIFAGTGNLIVGEATTFSNNYNNEDISHFNFVNEPGFDYNLMSSSPVIDSATTVDADLVPEFHYTHPIAKENRILHNDKYDVGAYEYISPVGIVETQNIEFRISPNPAKNLVTIKLSNNAIQYEQISILDMNGCLVYKAAFDTDLQTIDVSNLPAGIYIFTMTNAQNKIQKRLIIR